MKNKIIQTIREYGLLENCKGLVLCVSGGSDSMCLLHFFNENRGIHGVPFVVAHVNHGLRAESVEEERALREYCSERDIPIEVLRADINGTKPKGKSTEEYAREVRYDFFRRVCDKYGYTHVATAHNADDNGETVLLNLIRGCGIGGLCGIPVKREDGIIRPLIRCSKKEIYAYCEEHGLMYFTDKTNFENIYTRNLIRNEIVPLLERINPSFNESVARLTASAEADDEYLNSVAEAELEKGEFILAANELSVGYLKALPRSILSRVLRRYFFVNSPHTVLTNKQTNDIIYLINCGETSKRISLNGVCLYRSYGSLKISGADTSQELPFEAEVCLGDTVIDNVGVISVSEVEVSAENEKNCVSASLPFKVRSRFAGDRAKFPKRPEKPLKKLFIDDKIPSEKRNLIPIAVCGEEIVWVFGYGSVEKYRPQRGTKALCIGFKSF